MIIIKIGKNVKKNEFYNIPIKINTQFMDKGKYFLAFDFYTDQGELLGESILIYLNKE